MLTSGSPQSSTWLYVVYYDIIILEAIRMAATRRPGAPPSLTMWFRHIACRQALRSMQPIWLVIGTRVKEDGHWWIMGSGELSFVYYCHHWMVDVFAELLSDVNEAGNWYIMLRSTFIWHESHWQTGGCDVLIDVLQYSTWRHTYVSHE